MSPSVAIAALLVAQAGGVAAVLPPAPRPRIQAVRTAQPPVVDGKLDDLVWAAAAPSDVFTQHFPVHGAPPSERTEVRVLYDDTALYIGVDCEQLRSPIVRRLMRRDGQLPSDGVTMDIDSRRDGVSAFHFGINAAGVLSDAVHFNDTDYSAAWDEVWEAKVADTPRGYAIEVRIPLRVLRFAALPVQDWGFQVRRFVDARQEADDWALYPRTAASYVPYFGRIEGLVGLAPRRTLELRPFVLGRLSHRAADAGPSASPPGTEPSASAGIDAKAHVTNELTLDLTVNPDYGQVDADTVILNLSTFEVFFPEKRPFFLEGLETFSTIRPLVYTRRIGPIIGAAKLVGTVGGKTTLGLLSAVTGPSEVEVDVAGPAPGEVTRVRRANDRLAVYNVLRLKRLVAANADVGVLATAVNRVSQSPLPGGLCPATALPPGADGRCVNDAYVASVDGRWRSPSGDYTAVAQLLGATLAGGPPRAEPDGIPIFPGTVSGSASLYVGKQGGTPWQWGGSQHLTGRTLELNDLGYLERKNDYQGYFNLTYVTVRPWWKIIETRTTLQLDLRETLDGINLWNALKLSTWWNLSSFWAFYVDVQYRGAYFDDREMGDGAALERARRVGGEIGVSSDPRRRVLGSLSAQAQRFASGAHLEARGQLTLRVLPQLELDLLPTATYDSGEPRHVVTEGGFYIMGTQDARSVGATTRAAYTFTPELSLQFYAQVFLSRVTYPQFWSYPAPAYRQRVYIANLSASSPPAVSPDGMQATLNVNVVLRWEYRLGSTLFLVYSRAQNPTLTPVPGQASLDLHPVLRGLGAVDVAMIKLTYWWG